MRKTRNNTRITLPNGCECSQMAVNPANWKTQNANVKKTWRLTYRFYSPQGAKQVHRQGMNALHDLASRQQATQDIIVREMKLLNRGYNPILDACVGPAPVEETDYRIPPDTPFLKAVWMAFDLSERTGASRADLNSSLRFLAKSIKAQKLDLKPVEEVRKRHILAVLEGCGRIKKNFNNGQYNRYRSALLSVYKVFVKYDTAEYSPVDKIELKQHTPAQRHFVTPDEREMLNSRLRKRNYRLWNFVQVFFHSGARLTEMARLQGKNVNLDKQIATYYVKKRKVWAWVERPIPDLALGFWRYAMQDCGPDQYLFARNLVPGDKQINPAQYTRRWRIWVKTPLPDEPARWHKKRKREDWLTHISLYDLKHTHTTEVVDALDEDSAARINGHTSTEMVRKVYDLKHKSRKDEKLKGLNVIF